MLSDLRVVSFTHFLQGPSVTQLLGDLGADVIKIESIQGAFERTWSGPDAYANGVSIFFMSAHRNVRSLSIDLKSKDGLDIIRKLVAGADIVIENFRPGTMDRLGLGYDALRAIKPGLIFCSLSGYGSDGPYRDKPGQDLLIQSLSGLVRATGRADDPPTPVGSSIIDQHGAVLATMGILAALHKRDRTGEGTKVEGSLLAAALDLQMEPLSYHMNGFVGEKSKSGICTMFNKPPYGVFVTSDGYICLSTTPLAKLAAAFDDEWFLKNESVAYAKREEVNTRIEKLLAQNTTAHWVGSP